MMSRMSRFGLQAMTGLLLFALFSPHLAHARHSKLDLVQGKDPASSAPAPAPSPDSYFGVGPSTESETTLSPSAVPLATVGELPIWKTSVKAARALAGDGRAGDLLLKLSHGNSSSQGTRNPKARLSSRASQDSSQGVSARGFDSAAVTVNVAVGKGRYNISRLIYGVNEYGSSDYGKLKDAGIKLMRRGGNAESRYNWEFDAANHAADWFFESLPMSNPGETSVFDRMVMNNKANGLETVATIPVLNWLPKQQQVGCSFSVQKYGPQKSQASDHPDCGNGILNNGQVIKNDPNDVSSWTDQKHQQAWVDSLVKKFGSARKGGVRYYCMDNEPVWWDSVHWDVHPDGATYDEIVQKSLAFAPAIKQADPSARILGPVTGGWSDTFFSKADMLNGWHSNGKAWGNPTDRMAHGNKPFIQYYLEQMKEYQRKNGRRILDYFDFHAYVVPVNDDTDPQSQAQRIDGVRIFWDPAYTCSFCDWVDPITAPDGVPKFITRVKDIIQSTYPGIGMAITEYNFGGTKDISGAIAQAEALTIFAKLGVGMATVFPAPDPSSPVYMAFKMFGNFDGKGSKFGNVGVQADSSNVHQVSSTAAIDVRRKRLTVLINNLSPNDATVTVNFQDIQPKKRISAYRYSSADLQAIRGLPSISPSSSVTMTYPGYSITMLVMRY